MKHRKGYALTALVAGSVGLAGAAAAAPLSPSLPGASDTTIERIAGGCGPGYHPGYDGFCRPNFYGPRPVYGPRPFYRPPPPPFYGPPRPFYRPGPFF